MRLSRLLQSVCPRRITGNGLANGGVLADPEVTSVHCRSKNVRPGGVFVAVRGQHFDGHDYIQEALDRGAVAIVAEKTDIGKTIVALVDDSRKALALLSSTFYGNPADKLVMIGVTGTNGKTTTVALIETILNTGGVEAGAIGTANYRYRGKVFSNPLTTPESIDLQRILADMVASGVTHAVMEVSSHALDQQRIVGCAYDVAVFTNLTQDHLDYHKTMDAYWASKQLLFTDYLGLSLKKEKTAAVINCNDTRGRQLAERLRDKHVIRVGETADCMVSAKNIRFTPDGISGAVATPAGELPFTSPLAGHYNFENILCAVGVAVALGIKNEITRSGIASFQGVPGRLEKIPNPLSRYVFVDYAHTPDALANVLSTVRSITSRRLFCVFGCGGDRDRKKRPEMGRIAVALSDRVVITSDNPRTEDPRLIINEILTGVRGTAFPATDLADFARPDDKKRYLVEPDRSRGIAAAMLASRRGDAVVIAGKGSEPYQILKDRTVDFDDRAEARKALKLIENERQPDMNMCAT